MDSLLPLRISATGLDAQRMRMNCIASNLANMYSTRTEEGGPYKRRDVVFATRIMSDFQRALMGEMTMTENSIKRLVRGVQVVDIVEDGSDPVLKYEPGHPDANEEGYVAYPNITVLEEMTNMIMASRSYEANLSVIRATKQMAMGALDIVR